MDGDRFRWIGGERVYVPSRIVRPGDRVRLIDPKTKKPKWPAVVKVVDFARVLLSVRHGSVGVLRVVHWSRLVLEDDLPVQRELFDVIGGAA